MASKSSIFSRRHLLRTAPVAAALLSGAEIATGQQPPIQADISQSFEANLDADDIFAFVANENQTTYESAKPQLPDFDPSQQVVVLPGSRELKLVASLIETYRISQNAKLIGTVDATVPVTELVELSLLNHLLLRTGTPEAQRNAIIAAFSQYDWSTGPDPIAYITQRIAGTGVTTSMFAVRQSFHLTKKVGGRRTHDQQRNALRLLYGQQFSSSQAPVDSRGRSAADSTDDLPTNNQMSDVKLAPRIASEGYRLDLIATKAVGRMALKPVDAMHQVSGSASSTPNVIDIINEQAKGLDCQLGRPIQKRIATVFAFPEFMIKWDPVVVRIGCVRVTIWLPNLYIRFGLVVLWAYIGNPEGIAQFIVSQIEGCAIKSVLTGALIGIVLSNFAAALAAFRVVFVDCVSGIPARVARCLVPGLVLLTEHDGDWKPL